MSWKALTSLRGQLLIAGLVVWSALSVINSTHQSRVLYSELQVAGGLAMAHAGRLQSTGAGVVDFVGTAPGEQ